MIIPISLSPESRAIWDECYTKSTTHYPFSTFLWQSVYAATIGQTETPLLLSIPEKQIIAPFTVIEHDATFLGGIEISDYMDIIGPDEEKESVWEELIPYLRQQKIQTITLPNIPESSPTLLFFKKMKETDSSPVTIIQEDTTPQFSLPSTYTTYKESLEKKSRHELERKVRKFEREQEDLKIQSQSLNEDGIQTLLTLMKLDPAKQTFLTQQNEAFFRKLPEILSPTGVLSILFVANTPASAILAAISDQTFLLYNSGFNQQTFPGAGFYLKAKSIEYAIEQKLNKYNFLQGNERYKYELGGKDYGVYTITITLS